MEEAKEILAEELEKWRSRSYADLVTTIGEQAIKEVEGKSGVKYQIEIEVVWDDRHNGNLRVLGAIDDGGWRAFSPVTDDFILAPDGSFVDE